MNKPTYEQLEAQVKQLAAQLELSLAAERAWETTMMRVCGEDGPLSVAGKFNQLAAENAALKSVVDECKAYFISGIRKTIRPTNEGYLHMRCDTIIDETPATDTILASLRAEGVEMFAKHIFTIAGELEIKDQYGADFCRDEAESFAAQLRSKSEVQS